MKAKMSKKRIALTLAALFWAVAAWCIAKRLGYSIRISLEQSDGTKSCTPSLLRASPTPRKVMGRKDDHDYKVAALLFVAGITALALNGWASWLSFEATGQWQTAFQEQDRELLSALEDVRFVSVDEAPTLLAVEIARARGAALSELAASARGVSRDVVRLRARAEAEIVRMEIARLRGLGTPPDSEGLQDRAKQDAARSLAHLLNRERNRYPGLIVIDPESAQVFGDWTSKRVSWAVAASVPAVGAFFLGALAYRLSGGAGCCLSEDTGCSLSSPSRSVKGCRDGTRRSISTSAWRSASSTCALGRCG
jgi:hypothetical protein